MLKLRWPDDSSNVSLKTDCENISVPKKKTSSQNKLGDGWEWENVQIKLTKVLLKLGAWLGFGKHLILFATITKNKNAFYSHI